MLLEISRLRPLSLFIFLLTSSAVYAASAPPVKISADSLDLDQKNQSTTYSGDVLLTQGEMKLTAESLTVFVKDNKLGSIKAQGHPAHFETRLKDGLSRTIKAQPLIFSGNIKKNYFTIFHLSII